MAIIIPDMDTKKVEQSSSKPGQAKQSALKPIHSDTCSDVGSPLHSTTNTQHSNLSPAVLMLSKTAFIMLLALSLLSLGAKAIFSSDSQRNQPGQMCQCPGTLRHFTESPLAQNLYWACLIQVHIAPFLYQHYKIFRASVHHTLSDLNFVANLRRKQNSDLLENSLNHS